MTSLGSWFFSSKPKEEATVASQKPSSGCPVDYSKSPNSTPKPSECPVDHTTINKDNMMPNIINSPHQNQTIKLSTEKTKSSIKKDASENWIYPSPQQFYNALMRKGWDTKETEVDTMLEIHNFLNEECWKELLDWENRFHCDCQDERKLVKFLGRPNEPTPKARFLTTLGITERPFDRHDWTIDRCGKDVRYVIDYYGGGNDDKVDEDPVFYCDVRPALDSPQAAFDRMRKFFDKKV